MMNIMRNRNPNARAAAKDATHERIVSVAARAIRRSGYDGTAVADIMGDEAQVRERYLRPNIAAALRCHA